MSVSLWVDLVDKSCWLEMLAIDTQCIEECTLQADRCGRDEEFSRTMCILIPA